MWLVTYEVSKICSIFLRRGGLIKCKVTGSRQYSADLAQGGMEIPCILMFEGKKKTNEEDYTTKALTTKFLNVACI